MPAAQGMLSRLSRLQVSRKEQAGDSVHVPLFLGALGSLPPWFCVGPGLMTEAWDFRKVGMSGLMLDVIHSLDMSHLCFSPGAQASLGEALGWSWSDCMLAGRGARDKTLQA